MTRTDAGLTQEEIAGSLFRAYMHALGASNPNWEQCGSRDEALFMFLADRGGPVIEGMEGMSDAQAADKLQKLANEQLGFPEQPWESFDKEHQLALRAVTRHLCFLVDSDEVPAQITDMERHWKDWVQQKLKGES